MQNEGWKLSWWGCGRASYFFLITELEIIYIAVANAVYMVDGYANDRIVMAEMNKGLYYI